MFPVGRRICIAGFMFGTLGLAACGNPVVDDRVVENSGAEAFLDRIAKNCGSLSVGNQPLNYLLDQSNDDTYFVDESSKLYFGRVDKAAFATDINAFYPTGTNQRALDCIFEQLG